jgi:hypothetical protein
MTMRRRLFVVFLVLLLSVVGFGFYRGWFILSSPREPGDNRVNVNLTVDPGKMKDDARKVKELTSNAAEEVKKLPEKASEAVQPASK